MGFHICITNPKAVEISLQNGVYGNVGNAAESRRTLWGKIKDLYAVKPGDLIVLYVKTQKELYGVFKVTSIPYICSDSLFGDSEHYPFRFNFKICKNFPNGVPSFEFYSLIETGKINTIYTLEKDVNSSYRGIRQLFQTEFQYIVDLFHKYNPKTNPDAVQSTNKIDFDLNKTEAIDFDLTELDNIIEPVSITFNQIPHQGKSAILEDVLHAYLIYNLIHNTNEVSNHLELNEFSELILEAPIFKSMQYRSDILATFNRDNKTIFYSFIELKKKSTVGINQLSQLIKYLKSYASAKALSINSYEGIYISTKFSEDTINYLEHRKTVEGENIVKLISYFVDETGKVILKRIV